MRMRNYSARVAASDSEESTNNEPETVGVLVQLFLADKIDEENYNLTF